MKNDYTSLFSQNYLRIVLVILLFPFSLSAQEESHFPNEYGFWEVGYYWMDSPPDGLWSTVLEQYSSGISFDQDTLMILSGEDWYGYYYSTTDKVYFSFENENRPFNFQFNADEGVYYLLYDFAMEVGDTAYTDEVGMSDTIQVTVDSIAMENLLGNMLKHFYLSNGDVIVDKFGSLQGLFRPYSRSFEMGQRLCYAHNYFLTENTSTVYIYYPPTCFPSNIGIEEINMEEVIAYPNPANDLLNITSELPISNYTIYSATGMAIKVATSLSNNDLELNVSELPAGVYFVELTDQSGNAQTVHFMKN